MDELDRRLLELLRADGRMPMAELGRQVGLSRTATLARVRRLEETGAIRGYHADVRDGDGPAHVARVGIVTRSSDGAAFVRRLRAIREISEIESVAGEYDILVRVTTASADRLDDVLERINGWPQTARTTTWVVLKQYD